MILHFFTLTCILSVATSSSDAVNGPSNETIGTTLNTKGMSYNIEKVTAPVPLGTRPIWDARQRALYFVSIPDFTINKYVPASGIHTKTSVGGRVGFAIPVEDTTDQFIVGIERKFLIIRWDGAEGSEVSVVKEVAEIDKDRPKNRLNDGKCDPVGRLYSGSMGHEDPPGKFEQQKGNVFRVAGGNVTKVEDQIGITNGLAWDWQEKAFYLTDSLERKIRRYDFNIETGDISNMRYVFDLAAHDIPGLPDGTTVDTNHNLWVAVFNGSCILNINPKTGELLQKIPIPALQVTAVTFGGPDYVDLFVTTGSVNIKGPQEPPCGSTFKITGLGVKGYPARRFKP